MLSKRLILLSFLASTLSACQEEAKQAPTQTPPAQTQAPAKYVEKSDTPKMLLADFSSLMENEGAAVVSIETRSQSRNSNFNLNLPPNDPLADMFRRLLPPEPMEQSSGSGFIISPDGFILTNAHVISNANEILVSLPDQRKLPAKLMGKDPRTDIALLKIEAQNLPAVKIGNPAQLKVGEWVAAIGAPFRFDNTITAGIVSAKGRSLPDDNYVQFIQTDVAINPGNSGGPLFNLNGEVVGINSQIYSRSGGFMGISFAIPIDIAMQIAEQLKQYGKVSRGQMGVQISPLTPELAAQLNYSKQNGALIVAIQKNSPADKSGLQSGDIILSVNEHTIQTHSELPRIIGSFLPNTKIKLTIWRNQTTFETEMTLEEAQ